VIFILAFLIMPFLAGAAEAAELVGSFASGKAPYFWNDGEMTRGAELDIVSEVLRRSGYLVFPRPMPNNRLIATFPDASIDFAAGLQPDDLEGYCHSNIYMAYHNVAITKRARHIKLDGVAALLRHKVAIRQYMYPDLGLDRLGGDMPMAMPKNFQEFTSQDQQVRFFFADRSDVIILDRTIFQWYAKQLGLEEAVDYHDLFPALHGVRAVFKDSAICGQFDKNLAAIIADGTYAAIWRSYGIENAPPPAH
jgi:polar amino acid transport system substrate-binding protein